MTLKHHHILAHSSFKSDLGECGWAFYSQPLNVEAGLDSGQEYSGCWQNLFAVLRLRSHLLADCHPGLPAAPRGCSWAHWLSPSLLFQGWQEDPLCQIPFMLSVSLTLSSATSGRKPSACKGLMLQGFAFLDESPWIKKRQKNQRSNCQHLLDHRKKQENSKKSSNPASLTTLNLWLCGSQQTGKISKR